MAPKQRTKTSEFPDFNMLSVGGSYAADTRKRSLTGVYLGVETPYGERSMLIREANGITSTIPFRHVVSIRVAADHHR